MNISILAPHSETYEDLNNYSAVVKLTYKNASFMLMGDAEEVSEREILPSSVISPKSDVIKIGHHGSTSSTSQEFLNAVSPKYAVISVGKDNKYGHPAEVTLTRLSDAGIKTYRTDTQGTITAGTDGDGYVFDKKPSLIADSRTTETPNITTNVTTNATTNNTVNPTSEASKTVYITNTGEKYHNEGCKSLSKSKIPISLEEAKKKGFSACGICKP